MKLIEYQDYQIKIADEALLVRPIRRLFNQDRSERKERFLQQMSFMFFTCSPQSTYSYILDYDERCKAVIEQEGLPEDFKPSELLLEAMEIYKQHTVTPSQRLLNASLTAAETVSQFLKDPDILKEKDDKGRPLYKVGDVTKALKDVEGIVASLQNLQKKVDSESMENEGKARGTQELTIGDLGLD